MAERVKSKVGKTASNALRSYNRIINMLRQQCERYEEVSTVLGDSMKIAVVFTNKDGYIKYLGNTSYIKTISENCGDLLNRSVLGATEDPVRTEMVAIPPLPKPLSRLNAKSLQSIIPEVMKNVNGGGYIRWDKPASKPVWWPEDVVFANVKQRPRNQNTEDTWADCLRRVVSALYAHYGYNAETHVDKCDADQCPSVAGEVLDEHSSPLIPREGDSIHSLAAEQSMPERAEHQASPVCPRRIEQSTPVRLRLVDQGQAGHQSTPVNTGHTVHQSTPTNCSPIRLTGTPTSTSRRLSAHYEKRQPTTPTSSIGLPPLHLSGKRNWDALEEDPGVQDFVRNGAPFKRSIKPRVIFTPSDY